MNSPMSPLGVMHTQNLRVMTSFLSEDDFDVDGQDPKCKKVVSFDKSVESPTPSDMASTPRRRYQVKSPTHVSHDPSLSRSTSSHSSRSRDVDLTDASQIIYANKVSLKDQTPKPKKRERNRRRSRRVSMSLDKFDIDIEAVEKQCADFSNSNNNVKIETGRESRDSKESSVRSRATCRSRSPIPNVVVEHEVNLDAVMNALQSEDSGRSQRHRGRVSKNSSSQDIAVIDGEQSRPSTIQRERSRRSRLRSKSPVPDEKQMQVLDNNDERSRPSTIQRERSRRSRLRSKSPVPDEKQMQVLDNNDEQSRPSTIQRGRSRRSRLRSKSPVPDESQMQVLDNNDELSYPQVLQLEGSRQSRLRSKSPVPDGQLSNKIETERVPRRSVQRDGSHRNMLNVGSNDAVGTYIEENRCQDVTHSSDRRSKERVPRRSVQRDGSRRSLVSGDGLEVSDENGSPDVTHSSDQRSKERVLRRSVQRDGSRRSLVSGNVLEVSDENGSPDVTHSSDQRSKERVPRRSVQRDGSRRSLVSGNVLEVSDENGSPDVTHSSDQRSKERVLRRSVQRDGSRRSLVSGNVLEVSDENGSPDVTHSSDQRSKERVLRRSVQRDGSRRSLVSAGGADCTDKDYQINGRTEILHREESQRSVSKSRSSVPDDDSLPLLLTSKCGNTEAVEGFSQRSPRQEQNRRVRGKNKSASRDFYDMAALPLLSPSKYVSSVDSGYGPVENKDDSIESPLNEESLRSHTLDMERRDNTVSKSPNIFKDLLKDDEHIVYNRILSTFDSVPMSASCRAACGHSPVFRRALLHHIKRFSEENKNSEEQRKVVIYCLESVYDDASVSNDDVFYGSEATDSIIRFLVGAYMALMDAADCQHLRSIIRIVGLIARKFDLGRRVLYNYGIWTKFIDALVAKTSPIRIQDHSVGQSIAEIAIKSQLMVEVLYELKSMLSCFSLFLSVADIQEECYKSMATDNLSKIESASSLLRAGRDLISTLITHDTLTDGDISYFRSSDVISQLIERCIRQNDLGNYSHVLKIIVLFGENMAIQDLLLNENGTSFKRLFLSSLRCSANSEGDTLAKFLLVKHTCENIWLRNFLFQREGVILEILSIMRTTSLNNGDSLEVLSSFCGDNFFFDKSLSTGQIIQHFGEVFQFSENSDDVRHNAEELLLIFTEGLEKESIKQVGHKMEKKLSDISDSIATSFIESGILFMLLSVISSNDSTSEWRAKGANLLYILIRNRPIQEVFLEEPLSVLRCTVSTFEPFKDKCALFMELISIVDAIAGDAYTHARLFESEVIQDIINFISEVHENACRTKGSGDSNVNKYLLRSLNVLDTIATSSGYSCSALQSMRLEECLAPLLKKYRDHQVSSVINKVLSKVYKYM